MIIKKTVMISLLILAFIWQGTSLYGMHCFVARQFAKPLSKRLLQSFTKRRYCNRPKKGTDTIEGLRKTIDSLEKSNDILKKDTVFLEKRLDEIYKVGTIVFALSLVTFSGLSFHIVNHNEST